MNIVIMCEFSGIVREAFRARGHNAWSIDLEPTEIPGQHIQVDVLEYLEGMWVCPICNRIEPIRYDILCPYCGCESPLSVCPMKLIQWDMIIAFPPCTYLSSVGNRWMKNNPQRQQKREEAFEFFMKIINAPAPKICVENPQGYVNSHFRKPDQIVHPYYFGDTEWKRTCLWLKGLPPLSITEAILKIPKPKTFIKEGRIKAGQAVHFVESNPGGSKARSRTFPGIARAMAEQWG